MTTEFENFLHQGYRQRQLDLSKKEIEALADELFHFVFFLEERRCVAVEEISRRMQFFRERFRQIAHSVLSDEGLADKIAQDFFAEFPALCYQLHEDAEAMFQTDPAAQSLAEVYSAYPGFFALAIHRWAHFLWQAGLPVIPRMWTEFVHGKTGIDIHPGANIGRRFVIDHGTGIVIGETAQIGDDVKIYQGVTLGALSVAKNLADRKRHPTIEDGVTLYANATILGGETVIGKGSVIGGNVWITESIPPESLVYYRGALTIRQKSAEEEPIFYFI